MSAPSPPPRLFDPRRRAAHLRRGAARFAEADFLHRRAAESAADSMDVILRRFVDVVDLSPRPGLFETAVRAGPAAERVGTARAAPDIATVAQPGSTPLGLDDASVDLIVSLLGLHWADDLPGALAQIRRALRPDGLFLGAVFGAGTLAELRAVLTEAELDIRGGAQSRVSPFADGFDGAALMQRAGFAIPVVDTDRVTVRYSDLFALVRDLRAMGETNALAGPIRPLTRDIIGRAAALYALRFGEADGRIPATFEIIHLAGWAPHESQQKPLPRGSAKMRLADALNVREIKPE